MGPLGIGTRGEPWLFRRRNLLLRAESIGCWFVAVDRLPVTVGGSGCDGRAEELAGREITSGLGLKVTFRDNLRWPSIELEFWGCIRGVLSVTLLAAIVELMCTVDINVL